MKIFDLRFKTVLRLILFYYLPLSLIIVAFLFLKDDKPFDLYRALLVLSLLFIFHFMCSSIYYIIASFVYPFFILVVNFIFKLEEDYGTVYYTDPKKFENNSFEVFYYSTYALLSFFIIVYASK